MVARESVHGYGFDRDGQCAVFVKQMQRRIGFPSKCVVWTVTGTDGRSYRHAVLCYNVGHEVWMLDNTMAGPKWVGMDNENWIAMAEQFYSPARAFVENITIDGIAN